MAKAIGIGFALALGVILSGPAMAAPQGEGCTKLTEVLASTSGETVISSQPSRVCSVSFIATSNNGGARVFDSPSGASSHGQTRNISEPGAATSGNADSQYFGERGRWTDFGLAAEAHGGRLLIHWDD